VHDNTFDDFIEKRNDINSSDQVDQEINMFLNKNIIYVDGFNCLAWWNDHKNVYIKQVAKFFAYQELTLPLKEHFQTLEIQ